MPFVVAYVVPDVVDVRGERRLSASQIWRLIMSRIRTVRIPKGKNIPAILIVAALSAVLGSMAIAQQDRFTLQVPNGLAFSEIRGYETWQNVAVSQTETSLKTIVANDVMINAYRDGVPGNGKLFPDGSKIVKIEWSQKNPQFPSIS
jgi:hypothetical protein